MRTAIYIEGNVMQLVLTPDNDWEKKALASFHDKRLRMQFFDGTFYDCRGGWTRQSEYYSGRASTDRSLILRAEPHDPTATEGVASISGDLVVSSS